VTPPFHSKAAKEAKEALEHARDEVAASGKLVDEIDRILAEADRRDV
jgi:hypothetical protein